ncbi:MAG: glycosyltransferase family 2 protein [Candidatus Omnitrophica bacterium]|nr:glycosyltransferase family 2 protein [Candidatus Omnitrophota bacterium]
MSKLLPSLSLFFPAYYDENTIESLTRAGVEVAKTLTDDFEIIIIDDKSPDRTGEIADRLAAEFKQVRVIHNPENLGVGQAMITGYRAAAKDYVFYTDGDAQYDIRELPLLAQHAKDYDVVIGYRLRRAEGWKRVFTSRCFHFLVFLLFGVHYRDIDCSFKLLHRRFLDKLVFRTNSGLIDAETMIQANRLRFPVKEIGVHHYPRRFGRSQCLRLKLILSMLLDMIKLRLRLW